MPLPFPYESTVEVLESAFGGMPQGGDLLPDGRFVSVDTNNGRLVGWSPDARAHTLAKTTSGPIAVAIGTDQAAYLAHTGGRIGDFWVADDATEPSIQRLRIGAEEAETVLTEVDGAPLIAPHDLVWGADGRLWIADSHIWEWEADLRDKRSGNGRIIALAPDGTAETVVDTGVTFPAGIAAHADGSIVWTEAYLDRVRRWRPDGTVETVAQLPTGHVPHGIRWAADDSLWITSFGSSTLDVVAAGGSSVRSLPLGRGDRPMNLAFDGESLLVVEFLEDDEGEMSGRLLRVTSGVGGAPVFRGEISGQERPGAGVKPGR
ncbi:SMP-30/gluconolactonase/LRE family protein [Streptomyces sp. NPDC091280]|uniref:SMP-30/gluconolactonase/LRE family protein n=1 Tax=Streptomyces sp. NPDC091280 TaxID=3365984 RepID=UPI00380A027C